MRSVFSFSIYGTDEKYYKGMSQNINLIKTYFPSYYIYIYYGIPIIQSYLTLYKSLYDKIELIQTNKIGLANALERYRVLSSNTIDIVFIRDADSEINDRDRWCIMQFLDSGYRVHTIRDHYYHKQRLMAGLTGFKLNRIENRTLLKHECDTISTVENPKYGHDEIWLRDRIYPLIKTQLLIHTNINAFHGEQYEKIYYENNNTNFAGNVYEYTNHDKKPKFTYNDFPMEKQILWLVSQKQYQLIIDLTTNIPYNNITYKMANGIFFANYYTNNLKGCINAAKLFEYNSITEFTINECDYLYKMLQSNGKTITATTDVKYEPKENEIAVYYGSYPIDYRMFPVSNKAYRNAIYFDKIKHDSVQYDPCWENIDCIYILNLEFRRDRYIETMCELCKLGAPLDKIYHYKAQKTPQGPYIGATKNHLDVMEHMIANRYKNCLILEDDIVFNSDVDTIKTDLKTFMERNYDYDICFLAYSKYHLRLTMDDLLLISKQKCTTSSAYLLNSKTVERVRSCAYEGYLEMVKGGSPNQYCIDVYWNKLQQDDKMFLFKRKMGYQRPNYSNIRNEVVAHLD